MKDTKRQFLVAVESEFGHLTRLGASQSLFELGESGVRIYVRYSTVHKKRSAFYGLREKDVRMLEGRPGFLCFLWDDQPAPLVIPFAEYEEVFSSVNAASDGQYKVQVYLDTESIQFYVAQAGRFNVERYVGLHSLQTVMESAQVEQLPDLSHAQIQTMLGSLGAMKECDVWVPSSNTSQLDWSVARPFECRATLPDCYAPIAHVLQEVDVVWLRRAGSQLRALFEVEHSTAIYSGLLRLNDVHVSVTSGSPTYGIVANERRRSVFVRQVNRPTFRTSGLNGICSFHEYGDVLGWYRRVAGL